MIVSKILSINGLKSYNYDNKFSGSVGVNTHGLKMAAPLQRDTVSFKKAIMSNKAMGDFKDAISQDMALRIIKKVTPSHQKFVKLMHETFGDIISTPNEKKLLTYKQRIKSPFSIRQKTTSTNEELKDISGNAFILEDKKSFAQLVSRVIKLIKSGKINVDDLEYYRVAPIYKNGKTVATYNSLDVKLVQTLGDAVDQVKNEKKSILDIKPSPAGYSALHMTVKHTDGNYTEIQVMTRAMWDLKKVENLFKSST